MCPQISPDFPQISRVLKMANGNLLRRLRPLYSLRHPPMRAGDREEIHAPADAVALIPYDQLGRCSLSGDGRLHGRLNRGPTDTGDVRLEGDSWRRGQHFQTIVYSLMNRLYHVPVHRTRPIIDLCAGSPRKKWHIVWGLPSAASRSSVRRAGWVNASSIWSTATRLRKLT